MKKNYTMILAVLFGLVFHFSTWAQDFRSVDIQVKKAGTVDPKDFGPNFQPQFIHLEKPVPGGDSYKGFLLEQKKRVRELYPPTQGPSRSGHRIQSAPTPLLLNDFGTVQRYVTGFVANVGGGIPNDNTLAINANGQLVTAFNSTVWGWDLKTDTFLFDDQMYNLTDFATSGNSDHYDPKLLYDPGADRYILVFLEDRTPSASQIVVCFSTTNDPRDPWNSYYLPGNPLNNNRWTDYPAISVTDDALYVTGNLIIPGVSWQVGFDGSVIWQVDKQDGYDGAPTIDSRAFTDIRFDNRYIRNLHPVRGAYGVAESPFFLSNRNFALSNDSIFILQVTSGLDEPADLQVQMRKTNVPYGMPPNGRQQDTDPNDPTEGLQTNDARVLGAFLLGDHIQFVANTVDPLTGFSAVYHGFFTDVYNDPKVRGNILGHPTMDLGYPNIAYTGNEPCDAEAVIGVNYTSPTDFAGNGAYFFANDSTYSELLRIKDGEGYINRLAGGYERWGDYFGVQRRFESPGEVVASGFYGFANRQNGSWNSVLRSPDSIQLNASFSFLREPMACDGLAQVSVSGGVEPYDYQWSDGTSGPVKGGICLGDSVFVTIRDARGCSASFSKTFSVDPVTGNFPLYPNPTSDRFSVQFELASERKVAAYLYDSQGRMVQQLQERWVPAGRNEFTFSIAPLASGVYFLRLVSDKRVIEEAKVVKE
ncbi:MAG: T9SS type A sorting domain-containing protein [Bacteroidota bacterium]|nr:T9SS type A sorting domain-containing protein [Bacteroidota bacterium]